MRKKSIKHAAGDFSEAVNEILKFTRSVKGISDKHESWCFDLAIIHLYREFENLILNCLVALINNDSSTFSERTGRQFPKHMNVEVCEYLICGDGYFDFRGRDGLIKEIRKFVLSANHTRDNRDHWFLAIVKKSQYKDSLNQLIALRNFATHNSSVSKKAALECTDQKRMSSSGAWLKIQEPDQRRFNKNRFTKICESLKKMAEEIEEKAPY